MPSESAAVSGGTASSWVPGLVLILRMLAAAAALLGLPALADKGYHGAGAGILTPAKGQGRVKVGNARSDLR